MTARRRVLLGVVSALLGLSSFGSRAFARANRVSSLGLRLAAALPHAESAAYIGQNVIGSGIAPPLDGRQLRDRLAAACGTAGDLDDASDDDLRGAIRRLVAEDFAAERMVTVAGWRLAESEVAIYRMIAQDAAAA